MKARVLDIQAAVYADKDSNSAQIAGLSAGTEIELGSAEKNKGIKWVAVTLPKGERGYIRGDVKVFVISRVSLLQKEADVRDQPFAMSLVKKKMARGEQFDRVDIVESDNRKWIKVRDLQGQEGYIDGRTRIQERPGSRAPQSPARNMIVGAVWCIVGIGITAATYGAASRRGGTYVVAWGAIIFGGFQFLKGLFQLLRGK